MFPPLYFDYDHLPRIPYFAFFSDVHLLVGLSQQRFQINGVGGVEGGGADAERKGIGAGCA